jgi:GntR family transcriptional regulator
MRPINELLGDGFLDLNRSGPKPLYQQLEEILRNKIEMGKLKAHDMIPSENEIRKEFALSRTTVRNVITQLVNEGLLYRVPGKGTFVAEPKISTRPITLKGIREQLEEMGYETDTEVISQKIIHPPKNVALKLNLSEQDEVYFLERIRYANDETLSLHRSYIPVTLSAGLLDREIDTTPLCDILEKEYGLSLARGEETLESVSVDSREAELLGVKKGFHMLKLRYTMYTKDSVPFEYSTVLFRGDRIILKFEFSR